MTLMCQRLLIFGGSLLSGALLVACSGGGNPSPEAPGVTARHLVAPPGAPGADVQSPFNSRLWSRHLSRAPRSAAGSETVLYSFASGSDGAVPANDEMVAVNGAFYGITRSGGSTGCNNGGCGTVFKSTPSGGESPIYSFGGGTKGQYPKGGLVMRKGVFYGATQSGGECGGGTFFKIMSSGNYKLIYNFGCPSGSGYDAYNPYGRLIYRAATDTFYGTSLSGGTAACECGTVFSITATGKEAVLHSFAGAPDGNFLTGSLLYSGGYLYGTSQLGGSGSASACMGSSGIVGCGTIFRVSTTGSEEVLYSFTGGSDGAFPDGGLIDVSGKFYGMAGGGFSGSGCAPNCGNVFSITPTGKLHVIHTFAGPPKDAAAPFGNLTNVKGTLYGATQYGGTSNACAFDGVTGCGTVIRVTKAGKESVLYSFQGTPDGAIAQTTLVPFGSKLYGTTDFGGSSSACTAASGTEGCGTIFSITP